MKKKIVYISGSDVFDINDVRAAFDEVREMLHLDSDTVLFGVPVDAESEMARTVDNTGESVEMPNMAIETDSVMDSDMESDSEDFEPHTDDNIIQKDTINDASDATVANSNEITTDAPVVPIQSILTSETKKTKTAQTKKKKTAEKQAAKQEVATDEIEPDVAEIVPTEIDKTESAVVQVEAEPVEISVQETKIAEMITDDIPDEPAEKTLEELLESMAPLREDAQTEEPKMDDAQNNEEIDATLESLASEFADAQTTIPSGKKSSGRGGRIGKLKNILPFSNKKKDDTGLMGDLFGWAGIAANDEDFTIPGFFTNAAGKK